MCFFSRKRDGRTDGGTDGRTDRRTYGQTDRPSYRDARTHLKKKKTDVLQDGVIAFKKCLNIYILKYF